MSLKELGPSLGTAVKSFLLMSTTVSSVREISSPEQWLLYHSTIVGKSNPFIYFLVITNSGQIKKCVYFQFIVQIIQIVCFIKQKVCLNIYQEAETLVCSR